jgi:drug/metabolite transporter (DMT)-like permease
MNKHMKQSTIPAWKIAAALLMVYIIWGTTYFFMALGLQTMPPLMMNGSRFLCAGVLMLVIARWQGMAMPTIRQWRNAAIVGVLMVFCAMTLITFAQKLGIGSGLMATVVTTMPMWLALWSRLGGEQVSLTRWAGLTLGVAGACVLALERDFSSAGWGALFAFAAPLCWSVGSFASRKLDLPPPAMASAAQWLVGGALGVAVALVFEPAGALFDASGQAWLAWAYLLVFGTLVALNAYLWLLANVNAALAGSYSFVNPAVALMVGVLLGGEHLTGWVFAALPLIFMALGLIVYGESALRRLKNALANR